MNKIAIVNRTNFKNFGSVLQCYALCKAVEDLGYSCEILWEKGNLSSNYDLRPRKIVKILCKAASNPGLFVSLLKSAIEIKSKEIKQDTADSFDSFVKENFRQRQIPYNQMVKAAQSDEYRKFICGSDQIWTSTTLYVDPLMYLRFVPKEKRIAYAPSIGRNYIPDYNKREMRRFISEIPAVSIRETVGQQLIQELTGRKVPVVLDPTLLISKNQWAKLEKKIAVGTQYALCYFLDTPNEVTQDSIGRFTHEHHLHIVALGSELCCLGKKISPASCGPAEFLGYIDQADIVITDSYHGMLFAINYGKKFWAVERNYKQYDQSSRQLSVLKMIGCEHRYVKGDCEFSMDELDYDHINSIIRDQQAKSMAFLATAIGEQS